jgi:hypothetical protein
MFQNAAIDVAIGLILMYLMLSLLCTVANEFIATKLRLRSSTLRDALPKLIDDPTVLTNFYAHGLVASSSRAGTTGSQTTREAIASGAGMIAASAANAVKKVMGKADAQAAPTPNVAPAPAANVAPTPAANATVAAASVKDHPSYLAGGTVALALMGSLLKEDGAAGATGFAAVKSTIDNLPDSKLKDALQVSVLQANQDINALRQGIATWFDDSMDRLSGAYKRRMKWIGMLIGVLVAIAFNADSFNVATTLWNDADRRASTIEVATGIAKNNPLPAKSELKEQIATTETTLRSLPIGWNCQVRTADGWTDYWTCVKQGVPKLTLVQILGWFLTAAALTLGAPFWFDLLNQFINLRGAGAKPLREDKKTG